MNQALNTHKGYAAMLGYVGTTALASLVIHSANHYLSPMVSALYTFGLCLLFYTVASPKIFAKSKQVKCHLQTIVILNITTTICWLCTFFSLNYLPGDLFLFIYLCSLPITGNVLANKKWLQTFALFTGLLLLSWSYALANVWLGAFLAFVGGSSGTVYAMFSKKLNTDFSSNEILALRFYLIIAVTFVVSLNQHLLHFSSPAFYATFAMLAMLTVLLPLSLFQAGLKRLPLTTALKFLPLAPLISYLINLAFFSSNIHFIQLLFIIFISLTMLF